MRTSTFLISEMHDTAAEYPVHWERGVGVIRAGRWGCFLAACPVGRRSTGLGKQRDRASQASGWGGTLQHWCRNVMMTHPHTPPPPGSADLSVGYLVGSMCCSCPAGQTPNTTKSLLPTPCIIASLHHYTHTLGFQDLDCLLSSLSALVYSAWILLAGTTRSPSDFVTTTNSALSIMPLLMPWTEILSLERRMIKRWKRCLMPELLKAPARSCGQAFSSLRL